MAAHPERAFGHYFLGVAYSGARKDRAAEPHYLKTLELNPRFTFAMINLGSARERGGDLAGAERWYRKAAETDPDFPTAHGNLGWALQRKGDLAGAEAELRRAIELNPKSSRFRNNLGLVFQKKGDLAGAEAEYRQAIELDPKSELPYPRPNLARVRRMASLLPRLDDVLAGRAEPATAAEALGFAEVCRQPFRRRYAAAARLAERAFAQDPKLGDDLAAAHRYDTASTTVACGCGQGADAPADPASRAALRGKALAWLRADLALRARQAHSDKPDDRKAAVTALSYWLNDPDLAGVRPGPGRIDLPADERAAWDALWADVRPTLERARQPSAAKPPAPKPATAPAPGD